jgi:hypothetical protein
MRWNRSPIGRVGTIGRRRRARFSRFVGGHLPEMTHVLFDIPLSKLYRGVRPFIAIYLLALALITSVPEITLVPLRLWK